MPFFIVVLAASTELLALLSTTGLPNCLFPIPYVGCRFFPALDISLSCDNIQMCFIRVSLSK